MAIDRKTLSFCKRTSVNENVKHMKGAGQLKGILVKRLSKPPAVQVTRGAAES